MLDNESLKIINMEFSVEDRQAVIEELQRITLDEVMKESRINLVNTWHAILRLSKGDRKQVVYYTSCARKDFRDVIFWASGK
jgi:hypothetical protein